MRGRSNVARSFPGGQSKTTGLGCPVAVVDGCAETEKVPASEPATGNMGVPMVGQVLHRVGLHRWYFKLDSLGRHE